MTRREILEKAIGKEALERVIAASIEWMPTGKDSQGQVCIIGAIRREAENNILLVGMPHSADAVQWMSDRILKSGVENGRNIGARMGYDLMNLNDSGRLKGASDLVEALDEPWDVMHG